MKLNVTNKETGVYELEVEVSSEKWLAARQKAFKKLAGEVTVQGFRKGKAPEHLLKDKIDPAKELDEAIKLILDDAFSFALQESGRYPVMQPSYNVTKVSDKELTLVFTIVSAPTVKLGAYKDLEIGHEPVEVSEKAVEDKLNSYLVQNAELVLKNEAATLGDTVVLDFEGFVDDVAFEGGKASNHELELGSGQFIPGFEDALVGVKAGESRDVHVTFPENYHENLKGKKAVFKTTTHEVKTKSVPTLDDTFAASLGLPNVSDVASLRIHVLYELNKEAEASERSAYVEKLLAKLRETTEFEIAEDIIHSEGHHMQDRLVQEVTGQGMTWDQYKTVTGQTDEEIHDRFHEEARISIQNYLITQQIADNEKVEVSDAEVDFEVARMAQMYNMEEKQIREILGENIKNLKNDIRQRRIIDFLVENNK
ncbi:MAG: trigger factor [Bacilli bacterium]|nr:trigger factor [Bacilli bacterium]